MTRSGIPTPWPPNSFLGQLEQQAREAILRHGEARRFSAGEVLLHEGERSRHVFVLLAGIVKVGSTTRDGQEALLAIRGSGDILGDLAWTDGQGRAASVTTLTEAETRRISESGFREVVRSWPGTLDALTGVQTERMRATTRRRVELATCKVRERLARFLADLGRDYGTVTGRGLEIVGLPQSVLAAAIGCSEAALHNALRDLRKRGILETGRRTLVIRRPDLLDGERH